MSSQAHMAPGWMPLSDTSIDGLGSFSFNGTHPPHNHEKKPPVIPRTKIGKMDCLFLLPIFAGISLLILLVQRFGPQAYRYATQKISSLRGYEAVPIEDDEEPEAPSAPKTYMPSEGLAKDVMKRVNEVGLVAWIFDLFRFLLVVTLLALSIYATVVAHAPALHGHPDGMPEKGLMQREDDVFESLRKKGGKKHRKNRKAKFDFVTQEWVEFGTTVFYAYNLVLCAVLLGLKAASPLRRIMSLHLHVILFLAWIVFAYRDIYPLLTKHLTPVDVLHAPAWLTWTRLALLTVAAAVVPALQPRRYFHLLTPKSSDHAYAVETETPDQTNKAPAFLAGFIPDRASRVEPHITLTFAQSADGKIAGPGGKQVALSGKESMLMTHWMRSMHDAIMVGIGTAANDDPRLNVRLLPDAYHRETPQPIVLDPQLRLSPTARMLQALADEANPHARTPWILCQRIQDWDQDIRKRKAALEQAGARIIEHDMPGGRMDLSQLPNLLRSLDIHSVMVEGGASIIDQFVTTTYHDEAGQRRPLADCVIVTVAPMDIGKDGVAYGSGRGLQAIRASFKERYSERFGKDSVLVFQP